MTDPALTHSSNPRRALRWALGSAGLFMGLLVFGLTQLHLAILKYGPQPARLEPVGHPGALAVATRPGGRSFVSFDGQGGARLWNTETGVPEGSTQLGPQRLVAVPQVVADAQARLVVLNHQRSDLYRWIGDPRPAPQVRFNWSGPSRCGRYVMGFKGSDYVVVEAATGRELKRRKIGDLVSYTCDPHPQLRWVAWASPEGVAVAPLGEGSKRRLWTGPWTSDIPFVEFSPDGKYLGVLAAANNTRQLRIWETGTWKELAPLAVPADVNALFHWSPDSRLVALSVPVVRQYPSGWFGLQPQFEVVNVPQVWDLATRRSRFDWSHPESIRGHANRILELAWTPNAMRLLTVDDQGHLIVWDASAGTFVRFLQP